MARTKIIATLSNVQTDEKFLINLINNGVNVIRLNFSHMRQDDGLKIINIIKDIRNKINKPVAIMLDTKGPEVRLYGYHNKISVIQKQIIRIKSYMAKDLQKIEISEKNVLLTNLQNIGQLTQIGKKVLLMDGYIEGIITDKGDDWIDVEILNPGNLRPKAHLSIPNTHYPLPFLSEKDIKDITFAVEENLEYIALSFVSSSEDIFKVKTLIKDINKNSQIKLISKIENKQAIDNLEDIIRYSDGIMVARGDLGVELPLEDVPIMQKKIIENCYLRGKPVITATQMLESMIENRIPTRAEVSDVANACYDLTSAVMLSGETAIGKFPELVVDTMKKIVEKVEKSIDYSSTLYRRRDMMQSRDLTSIISYNAVSTAIQSKSRAILVFTKSGYSARMISKLRPFLPIYAFTPEEKVFNQLSLNWGIIPILIKDIDNFEKMLENAIDICVKKDYIKKGDMVVVVAGLPLGVRGRTNMIRVETVGKNRFPGKIISKGEATAPVIIVHNKEDLNKNLTGKIAILKTFEKEFAGKLRYCSGIVADNDVYQNDLQTLGFALNIPILISSSGCAQLLQDGALVSIDSENELLIEE